MNIRELEPNYSNDMIMKRNIHDSRKPVVTIKLLNKLKKMRVAKDLENLMRFDFLEIIYGSGEPNQ